MRLLPLTIALFVIGAGLMFVFDSAAARVPGMAALFGFIVCGLFLIARPDFLSREDEEGGSD